MCDLLQLCRLRRSQDKIKHQLIVTMHATPAKKEKKSASLDQCFSNLT
uniref:Uncharacterized protein n=1 Tax=Arundo donax TaxID=35708 RepID=A0A0A9GW04_ARUDO